MAERISSGPTVSGWCEKGSHGECSGNLHYATGWNWWCTCSCHPEPKIDRPEHQPALDFWRKHRPYRTGQNGEDA